jgi:AraC-like DNA-binding protein
MYFLVSTESIFLFVSAFGTLQCFLLAFLIYFHHKSDRRVNKFLALYTGCTAIIMSGPLILQLGSWQQNFFTEPFTVIVGPMMYLYIRSFKEIISWKKAFPHLIPFIAYFIASVIWVSYLDNKYPASKAMPTDAVRSNLMIGWLMIRYIILYLYYFLSRRELIIYQRSIRHLFSETSQLDLNWIRLLITGYLILISISVAMFVVMLTFPHQTYLLYLVTIALATPYVYLCTFKSITQPTIWQKTSADAETLEQQMSDSAAMEKSKQSKSKEVSADTQVTETASRIVYIMETNRLYQETELTLQDLSDKLQLPAHRVSTAINEGLKKNFYDLVNGYRVEEAKRLLLHPGNANYTILSVGFEAGFNSKTTFNTVFKKFTGQTPTEFRDKQRQVRSS